MSFETRTAPENARYGHILNPRRPSAGTLAAVDGLLARMAATPTASTVGLSARAARMNADPAPEPNPAPPAPTDAERIDGQALQLADHEARIAALETAAAGNVEPADGNGSATAVAEHAAPKMIDASAIYARMTGRTSAPPMPTLITGADGRPMLDARAILERHGAHQRDRAAASAPRASAPAPGKLAPAGTTVLNAREINARMHASRSV